MVTQKSITPPAPLGQKWLQKSCGAHSAPLPRRGRTEESRALGVRALPPFQGGEGQEFVTIFSFPALKGRGSA